MEENSIYLVGTVVSPFTFDYEKHGEKFYRCFLEVKRMGENKDVLPLLISERIADISQDCTGQTIKVSGAIHSYHTNNKVHHLILSVMVNEMYFLNEEAKKESNNNTIISGQITKTPIYRKTPLGRIITDIMLTSSRENGKKDYIPVVAWGHNANYASGLEVGDSVSVHGRFQSRDYIKKLSETNHEKRVAYEVSASKITKIESSSK